MQRKALAATIEWKAEKAGAFRATYATLGVVDHDKDVTLPGAFKNGQQIVISAYMHKSWDGALPVGAGVIGADDTKAWVDGQFFDTAAGTETYKTVKALAEKGLGEWSYGYDPLKASSDQEELNAYPGAMRILKELDVFEVSPVLKGAGIDTATDSIKSLDEETLSYQQHGATALAAVRGFAARSKALASMRAKEGRTLSAANRDRLAALQGTIASASADLAELLSSTELSNDGKSDGKPEDKAGADAELQKIFLDVQRRQAELVGDISEG